VGSSTYSHRVDIWAIGCIFVELVTGRALFTGDSDFDMLKLVLRMFSGSEELPEDLQK
jgi:serine/threonine protein kinase